METEPFRHIPEGSTLIFEGPQRSGKTLAGVLWALDAHQKGRTVFTTIPLAFPHRQLEFTQLELEDSGQSRYWNGHVFIDELNFFFDARASMSKGNKKFSAYLLQQKKQGCNLTGTTHGLDYLDVRLRQNYDFLINPTVYPTHPATPEVLVLEVYGGPLHGAFYRKLKLRVLPSMLRLYNTFQVYNPFKDLVKK